MFTGLIEEVGHVLRSQQHGAVRRITIAAPRSSRALEGGDSIAVSGVCLTATAVFKGRSFAADLAQETLSRTSLGELRTGALVNLELPMRSGARLGGHIVQGHVDGVAKLLSLMPAAKAAGRRNNKDSRNSGDWWLRIELPTGFERYVVEKGSITVEGISLTVAKIATRQVTIAVVPHTYKATNLRSLKPRDAMNIEVDVLAKYAEKMLSTRPTSAITLERLVREGF